MGRYLLDGFSLHDIAYHIDSFNCSGSLNSSADSRGSGKKRKRKRKRKYSDASAACENTFKEKREYAGCKTYLGAELGQEEKGEDIESGMGKEMIEEYRRRSVALSEEEGALEVSRRGEEVIEGKVKWAKTAVETEKKIADCGDEDDVECSKAQKENTAEKVEEEDADDGLDHLGDSGEWERLDLEMDPLLEVYTSRFDRGDEECVQEWRTNEEVVEVEQDRRVESPGAGDGGDSNGECKSRRGRRRKKGGKGGKSVTFSESFGDQKRSEKNLLEGVKEESVENGVKREMHSTRSGSGQQVGRRRGRDRIGRRTSSLFSKTKKKMAEFISRSTLYRPSTALPFSILPSSASLSSFSSRTATSKLSSQRATRRLPRNAGEIILLMLKRKSKTSMHSLFLCQSKLILFRNILLYNGMFFFLLLSAFPFLPRSRTSLSLTNLNSCCYLS